MPVEKTTPMTTTREVTTNFTGPPTESAPVHGEATRLPAAGDSSRVRRGAVAETAKDVDVNQHAGKGMDGEDVVWEARYAMKNFIGRLIVRTLITVAWIALAVYTWGYSDGSLALVTILAGIAVGVLWLMLIYRIIQARFGHYYRLTTRRLFISTGLMRRRRDMMELLRVKDVYTKQTLIERWLSLGTVVVVCSDRDLPTFYIAGVDDPKRVMDLIWHHARAEREGKSLIVDHV